MENVECENKFNKKITQVVSRFDGVRIIQGVFAFWLMAFALIALLTLISELPNSGKYIPKHTHHGRRIMGY